ncbi:uncharacterized protein N7443_002646 [Penicillium atrosanguineum]|uniref:uncharacterized protein n=1 Tax=Penicillium atrosanguineum TaxID=1132637 RepID=UPI00238F04CD|nr:uncharacterized protein N7443_002646 [Penicillium atrosanguineum]KAJ5122544.1 hypothetical protein N7526_009481 [Penicillium atrosanguineum]KAJ5310185.1 hypothetical protein N7443_002646 [Penicillium atrosanguineum]
MAIDMRSRPRDTRLDSEQDRIRDLSRYYCTFDEDPQPTTSPRLSPDSTLTALTQLGVYRFGCNRSFVSIIDGEQQHLISEATASISLCKEDDHLPDDGIYLGVRTLDLEWGVCPHAMRLFTGQDPSRVTEAENITANRTRNIIRDFTKEEFYNNRPYVLEWPYFRFYAEVPLYSPSGYVLGSYCVVDNKPRAEFSDKEVAALQEIADAISQHLENVRVVRYHKRAENLVKGLTNFVKGHTESESPDCFNQLASPETLNFHNLNSPNNGIQRKESNASQSLPTSKSFSNQSVLDRSSSTVLDEGTLSMFSEAKESEVTLPTTQPSSLAPGTPETTECIGLDEYFPETATDDVPIAERVASIFTRASSLLRASMDIDGVTFLDARQSDSQFDPWDEGSKKLSFKYGDSGPVIDARPWVLEQSAENSPDSESLCRFLDHGLGMPSTEHPDADSRSTLSEGLLSTLIKTYPGGQIFNMDDESCETETTQQEVSRCLAQSLPEAKSILFIPLWDWNKSYCLAGTVVWTKNSHRPFGMEELHYFKVFGDSIVSEISRVHWKATERSKFDFVSSISHELRSPLHGILGSTELIQSTPLQPTQHDMTKMIEKSGLILLNTIDHLLEYCKINDLVSKNDTGSNRRQNNTAGPGSDFDLGTLVEQVATVLCAGQNPQFTNTLTSTDRDHQISNSNNDVSVVVRIENLDSWMVRSASGPWRRILMNIIGNAMKWTKKGLIEITLTKAKRETKDGSSFAHLCVKDTGIGISREYLKNMLFSPFAQEDPLSPGVGLGLSIVRKLVMSLDGDIDVRSELGAGTQVEIYIPVTCLATTISASEADDSSSQTLVSPRPVHVSILGLQDEPDLNEIPTGILSIQAKRKASIHNSLTDVLMTQLGWNLSFAKHPAEEHADVAIIEEEDLRRMLGEGVFTTESKHMFTYFIVLGGRKSPLVDDLPANIIYVSQPFGPRSLHDAAERFMKIYEAPIQPDITELAPIASLSMAHQQVSSLQPQEGSSNISETSLSSTIDVGISPDPPNPLHVLVVDDNDINLKIMSVFMRKIGCQYETASNGQIGLEKYKSANRQYNFILMDISMPVMDGLVATKKIREHERHNGLDPSRIVAVTAVASNYTQEAALKAGVNDYLVKPLSFDRLRGIMDRVINAKESQYPGNPWRAATFAFLGQLVHSKV